MYTLLTSIKGTISRKQFFLATLFRGAVSIAIIVLGYALVPSNSTGDYITGMGRFLLYTALSVGTALAVFVVGMIPSVIKRLRESGNSPKRVLLWIIPIVIAWLGVLGDRVEQLSFLKLFFPFWLWIFLFGIIICMSGYLLLKAGEKLITSIDI